MNSQEIVDYVMNTLHNTNPAILKQMIDANSSGGGCVTSWNDLKDKPFGETIEKHYLLEETEITTNLTELSYPKGFKPNGFKENDAVVIKVGDTIYESTLKYKESSTMPGGYDIYVGNLQHEDCPVCVHLYYDVGNTIISVNENVPLPTTISVYVSKDGIKTLDEKYIPDTIARISDISGAFDGSWNNLKDKPFYAIEERELIAKSFAHQGVGGPFTGALPEYGTNSGGQYVLSVSALIPGDTYIAIVNGKEYIGIAESCEDTSSDNNMGINLFYHGEHPEDFSDAPISLGSYSNSMYISFEKQDISYDVELYHNKTVVKTLDPKYLPKPVVADATGETVTGAEFNALLAALRSAGYLAT